MKQKFIQKRFTPQSLRLLETINAILSKYERQNLDLSLRQLYYQLVATAYDELPDEWIDPETGSKNNTGSYKKIGDLVNNGRLAGVLDWSMLKDRGRSVDRLPTWDNPVDRLEWAAKTHRLDKWQFQPMAPWVMIEKQALEGVMIPICRKLEIPFIANKGYSSASSMYEIGREMRYARLSQGRDVIVLYLGDHDPSGLDMTNDVKTRLEMFSEGYVEIKRLALNMDQIQLYNPPPNPAKETDSRYKSYRDEWGQECWELDALTPNILIDLVSGAVNEILDEDAWEEALDRQKEEKKQLSRLAERIESGEVSLSE